MGITDENTLVISFDLENVFALPRTSVSSAFYKRKLNVFNLTARFMRTTKAYCAVWAEAISSHGGSDIASALNTILKLIVIDHPSATKLVPWSDSCVPQN